MAIINPKCSAQGKQLAFTHVEQTHNEAPSFLGAERVEELKLADPHMRYHVELAELFAGRLLAAAKPVAWRYLVMQGNQAIGDVQLHADQEAKKASALRSINRNSFAQATLEALQKAKPLLQAKPQDYEVRYLQILPVYLAAVWLHAQSEDILVPLPPTYGRMNEYQHYSEREMLAVADADTRRSEEGRQVVACSESD